MHIAKICKACTNSGMKFGAFETEHELDQAEREMLHL